MNCCLKCCGKEINISDDSRVEVKTVLPSRFNGENFHVLWNKNEEAKFHLPCWNHLLNVRTSANRKNSTKKRPHETPDSISKQEKALIREARKTAEFFDSGEQIKKEASRVAEMLKSAKHCVVFTGAGISTSAGIGDYRGKSGKWTEMDHNQVSDKINQMFDSQGPSASKRPCLQNECSDEEDEDEMDEDGVDYEKLRPTFTHEALCLLMDKKLIKHVVSQNGDGLHGLSGISKENLSELHGNVFIEKCEKCGHRYERSFYVMDDEGSQYYEDLEDFGKSSVKKPKHAKQCERCGLSHRTGRKCEQKDCTGYLMDTIINFRDNLEEEILTRAFDHAYQCDLMICLGSTLTVTPANELVDVIEKPHPIVICNRQKTDYDDDCLRKCRGEQQPRGGRVYGDCDEFMREVLKNIIGERSLKVWEEDRPKRLINYDKCRSKNN
ncbi:NAD-dependent protein deacetylase Sirt6-like isoform X2 [Saccostrea echinata]|uniref:NAD-dependent protein deacetylase Sirt6-like isoform X2 n=1 Tax=Saccostrea echinata TaxID=191078 RepID=UPI002A7EC5A1|nr:NAD-dependent protein deacetylase Sirt6-like isoform X2 [Saccostrea echinata]